VLRRIFVPERDEVTGEWRKLHYVELNDLCGPDSLVGIATGYGLDGPGIEFRWGEIFRSCLDRRWGHVYLCIQKKASACIYSRVCYNE
jgi:hypothetical protein